MYPEGVKRKLAPYMAYIQQRWKAGCHNWRELRQLGFDGSRGLVAGWAAKERASLKHPWSCPKTQSSESTPKKEAPPWSASRASWLFGQASS